jgi:hypothetical protein
MIIEMSSDAVLDLEEGFAFYQRRSEGLGAYFISCLTSDIEALEYFGGIHQVVNGSSAPCQNLFHSASTMNPG